MQLKKALEIVKDPNYWNLLNKTKTLKQQQSEADRTAKK